MFENIGHFFKRMVIKPEQKELGSKDAAKERLHLVLMQDRANVSADFLELMKQEIIDVIKKYIVVDESSIDVRLTNQPNIDGTNGAPSLYANIPIVNIKNDMMAEKVKEFEGVDFNKEMGIYIPSENTSENQDEKEAEVDKIEERNSQDVVENENVETVISDEENNNAEDTIVGDELEDSNQEQKSKENVENEQENKKKQIENIKKENNENQSEDEQEEEFQESNIDYEEDDDDDDVTFDDLLKAAEEEEKQNKKD